MMIQTQLKAHQSRGDLALTLEELVHEFYFKLDSVLVNECFKM